MKICLVGSAPSSAALAPYDNPDWKIWACSPGSCAHLKRVDAFFELHRWEPHQPWFNIEYRAWLAIRQCPVYMIHPVECIPLSVAYPKDDMLAKFGPWFFTSSLSWMFALAIHQGAKEIMLAGVDMSAQEEWEFQRSGCHYFIGLARAMGIKVHIPPESDLLEPPPLYGFREVDAMHIKLLKREEELAAHVRKAEADVNEATHRLLFFKGARDCNLYTLKTWVSDPLANAMSKWNPGDPLPPAQMEALKRMQATVPNTKPEPFAEKSFEMAKVDLRDRLGRDRDIKKLPLEPDSFKMPDDAPTMMERFEAKFKDAVKAKEDQAKTRDPIAEHRTHKEIADQACAENSPKPNGNGGAVVFDGDSGRITGVEPAE